MLWFTYLLYVCEGVVGWVYHGAVSPQTAVGCVNLYSGYHGAVSPVGCGYLAYSVPGEHHLL